MIDISPKALRFARLAAEQQSAHAADPQVEIIKRAELAFEQKSPDDRIGRHVRVSDPTAAFCLRAINGLLQDAANFRTSDWDGNDYAFLRSVARDLDEQLLRVDEKAL